MIPRTTELLLDLAEHVLTQKKLTKEQKEALLKKITVLNTQTQSFSQNYTSESKQKDKDEDGQSVTQLDLAIYFLRKAHKAMLIPYDKDVAQARVGTRKADKIWNTNYQIDNAIDKTIDKIFDFKSSLKEQDVPESPPSSWMFDVSDIPGRKSTNK